MKKYIIYAVILITGLLLGYLFFGTSESAASKKVSGNEEQTSKAAEDTLWTCSMHPQILQHEPGDCPICGMDLIPVEKGQQGNLDKDQFKMTKEAVALANIQTTKIGNSEVSNGQIQLSGKIEENEEGNAVQVAYFDGRIEKLYINTTGEKVGRGQVIASIYSPQLVAAQQELLTTARLKESQPDLYKAVRNKLKLWKLSEKQISQIENSGKVQENFPVFATVSGVVSEKLVQEGDYVKQGQPLFKIADLGTVWAVFDAYENQISGLKEGEPINIQVNSYPGKNFTSKISFISPMLNSSSRTVKIRATLQNQDNLLKPGMFVKGSLEAKNNGENTKLLVPKSAVLWTGERSVVYTKPNPEEPVFKLQEITLGNTVGNNYEVLSGLQNGDKVVTNGTFTVDAAAQLQGKNSMMNQPEKTSDEERQQFQPLLNHYLSLKNALFKDDLQKAKTEIGSLSEAISELNHQDLKSWNKFQKQLNFRIKIMESSENLKEIRSSFDELSAAVIGLIKTTQPNNNLLYVQHCPMADNKRGADWLSLSSEIQNPYLGGEMPDCGAVRDSIQ